MRTGGKGTDKSKGAATALDNPTLVPTKMASTQPSSTWQPRPRIRPKRCQSSPILDEQFSRPHFFINCADAETHGPLERGPADSGLVETSSTRSLNLFPCAADHTQHIQQIAAVPPPPDTADNSSGIGVSNNATANLDPISAAAPQASGPAPPAAAASSVQPAFLGPLFPPTQGIAIRHEYLLEMSKKSKRQAKAGHGHGGGGADIMDSLVSSIGEIESKQMRGLAALANGHRRQRSESIGSVTSVSPAPVIQTSKSSTRSPGSGNKLVRRGSLKSSGRDSNGRQSLRNSSSQEHWLPPIEQEEDIFSVAAGQRSYSSSTSNTSAKHPSIPARTTSMTHEIQIPQRSNSLLHSSVPPPIAIAPRSAQPRRSETSSDIPSYITRYLRERTDSKENLAIDGQRSPLSPRRPPPSSRNFPSRSRNSTTAIPGNDQFSRLKLVTKRQSSQGFERDMSATRHYYSLPPSASNGPRRSASLRPSRSSVGSDGSTTFSKSNSTYAQEVLDNPKLTQRIRLTNGRILSFSEVN